MAHEHRQPVPRRGSWRGVLATFAVCMLANLMLSCGGEVEHTASAVNEADSLPFMHALGINTIISDSGVARYHMVAEEWDIYNREGEQSTWKFYKGLLMERYDKNFHIDLYVQSDTAYLHRQQIWELRGRVVVRNTNNDLFLTEELFWDMTTHEMWNHQYMHIITPERELEGTEFRSNEQMTRYSVMNSIGLFPVSDTEEETVEETPATTETTEDPVSEPAPQRDAMVKPQRTGSSNSRFLPAPDKRK